MGYHSQHSLPAAGSPLAAAKLRLAGLRSLPGKFLNFWLETLEGPLHSVTVAHARLIRPAEIRAIDGVFRLH